MGCQTFCEDCRKKNYFIQINIGKKNFKKQLVGNGSKFKRNLRRKERYKTAFALKQLIDKIIDWVWFYGYSHFDHAQ